LYFHLYSITANIWGQSIAALLPPQGDNKDYSGEMGGKQPRTYLFYRSDIGIIEPRRNVPRGKYLIGAGLAV